MRIELDKEDIKLLFGPLGANPGASVFAVDKDGEELEFEAIVLETKLTKLTKKQEEFTRMFGS